MQLGQDLIFPTRQNRTHLSQLKSKVIFCRNKSLLIFECFTVCSLSHKTGCAFLIALNSVCSSMPVLLTWTQIVLRHRSKPQQSLVWSWKRRKLLKSPVVFAFIHVYALNFINNSCTFTLFLLGAAFCCVKENHSEIWHHFLGYDKDECYDHNGSTVKRPSLQGMFTF